MPSQQRYRPILLVVLWGITTVVDMDKPFHVDDAFHLEMAQWVEAHPTRPMSGMINWGSGLVPMHTANQPPGFFYLMAVTGHILGYTTTAMHGLRALFSLLAIICFFRLARWRVPGHAMLLTSLLAVGPAFLVNQGVMLDVPLLAAHLLFFDLLLVPRAGSPGWRYAAAGLVLCFAISVKYTSLPLLCLFPLVLVSRKEYRYLVITAIPVVFLLGWSLWNVQEFGHVHLAGRGVVADTPWSRPFSQAWAFITTIGAVAPFAVLFIGHLWRPATERTTHVVMVAAMAGLAFMAAVFTGIVPRQVSDVVLLAAFTLNGSLFIASCVFSTEKDRSRTDRYLLLAWAGSLLFFVVLFAPTMATRHVLLVLPPLLLLGGGILPGLRRSAGLSVLAITAFSGIAISASDKASARFYASSAGRIAQDLQVEARLWSVGHWGWQWYSRQAGMLVYPDDPVAQGPIAAGDVIVRADAIHGQWVDADVRLYPLFRWNEPRPWWSFLYAGRFAGMYSSDAGVLPWSLDRDHQNTITASRVISVDAQ